MVHVALSFDDGPDGRWTPVVLDALRAAGARATFFVLGACARRHPDVVRRTIAEGHAVQVHGDGHVRHTELSRAAAEEDLDRALAQVAESRGEHGGCRVAAPVVRVDRPADELEVALGGDVARPLGLDTPRRAPA